MKTLVTCSITTLYQLPFLVAFALGLNTLAGHAATVQYEYDAQHQLVRVIYADGATINYAYDPNGNRVQMITSGAVQMTYEDGEDMTTAGWEIYDNNPAGATIINVFDEQRDDRAIEFIGTTTKNGYRLKNADGTTWNNLDFKVLEWNIRYSENFIVYVAVQTTKGFRYLYYTPANEDKLGDSTYIHHGLGQSLKDGNWHLVIRDLEYDLKEAQPDNTLLSVDAFLIRGSGRIDDIRAHDAIPEFHDSDLDGISDHEEINVYATHPYHEDSDNDGLTDFEELTYWGTDWNSDPDGDSLINILDADADNDGVRDGFEMLAATDPADGESTPESITLEDGEDSDTLGWQIYDNDPEGAVITNVFDEQKAGRVIEFIGSQTKNGYRLRNQDGSNWNITHFKVLEWNMQYQENCIVYIAAQTADGFRYLYYTTADYDKLGDGTYIHHGLGASLKDGSWQTVIRDLEYDLKEAQPDNTLLSIDAFLIRGSGRVDDIKVYHSIPAQQDSDHDGISDIDEINTYTTHPYYDDSDNDGLTDFAELTYWGSNWNGDPDGDARINILDEDADNDGVSDGFEVQAGTDPADPEIIPEVITFEDAQDTDLKGWQVYDNDPAGAAIANVFDDQLNSQVIEFNGVGTKNGFRLKNEDGSYWNNRNFPILEWKMRYTENFVIYFATQTTDGFRYLYYTPATENKLGDSTYIHHGLGTSILDGNWNTVSRDLKNDLKEAQPDNELLSIDAFLIRGNGRIDDVKAYRK
ncbi:hypothetical protein [Desulfogranum marinum]|uniref:hypothetical protein n=1 Tax=Desulfogranum marinum TaxID=453220 RepID=UPI0029C89296|nr:hypothetical protein [Desulfogranum marinum]